MSRVNEDPPGPPPPIDDDVETEEEGESDSETQGGADVTFPQVRCRVLLLATCNGKERPIPLSGHKSFVHGRKIYYHHLCGLYSYDIISFQWKRLPEFLPSARDSKKEASAIRKMTPAYFDPGDDGSPITADPAKYFLLPLARRNHSFHYVPHLNAFLIFGGIHQVDTALAQVMRGDRLLRDSFLYDIETSIWYNITPRNRDNIPTSRCSHVSVWRTQDRSLYLFGGIIRRRFATRGDVYMHRLEIPGEPGEGPEARREFFMQLGDRLQWDGINVLRRMTLKEEEESGLMPPVGRLLQESPLSFCTPLFPLGNGVVLTYDESEMIVLFGLRHNGMNALTYAYSFERKMWRVLPTRAQVTPDERQLDPDGPLPEGFPEELINTASSPSFVRREARLGALALASPPVHPPLRVYFGCARHSRDKVLVYGGERYNRPDLGSQMVGDMFELNLRTLVWRKVVEVKVEDHVESVVRGRGSGGYQTCMQTLQARTNCAVQRRGRFLYLMGGGLGDRWRTNQTFLVDLRDYTLFCDGCSDPCLAVEATGRPFVVPEGFVDVVVVCQGLGEEENGTESPARDVA